MAILSEALYCVRGIGAFPEAAVLGGARGYCFVTGAGRPVTAADVLYVFTIRSPEMVGAGMAAGKTGLRGGDSIRLLSEVRRSPAASGDFDGSYGLVSTGKMEAVGAIVNSFRDFGGRSLDGVLAVDF
jgi:hypothetical protein